ncbi:hypothetical protein PG999_013793 [Apiospora kogelbergensis]|uniref:RRM domain-containing protein n=1 Tax=Apiospora kogelbergensis TaxID=1337665 RepID=A0AAW0Q726_9PEZI
MFNSNNATAAANGGHSGVIPYRESMIWHSIYPPFGLANANHFGDGDHRSPDWKSISQGARPLTAGNLPGLATDKILRFSDGDDNRLRPLAAANQLNPTPYLTRGGWAITNNDSQPRYEAPAGISRPEAHSWRPDIRKEHAVADQPVTNPKAAYPPRSPTTQHRRQLSADTVAVDPNFQFAETYSGNRMAYSNYSANIPDHLNCSVFMRGLPPTCSHSLLLSLIRGCGSRVWALHINRPDTRNPHNCAAKLVFHKRCGVDWLFEQIRNGQFVVDGYRPNAVLNKIKSAPMPENDLRCRVVCVSGPPSLVNLESLGSVFRRNFYYDMDQTLSVIDRPDYRLLEFRFGSARCQGENAIQALQSHKAHVQSLAA